MSADRLSNSAREKPFAVAVLRIGSHPLVYSIVFIAGVGALVFFLGIAPMVRMLQTGGKASVGDAQNRNNIAQDTLNAENKLAGAADAVSPDDQALLAYALPTDPDVPGLAIILKSLAAKSAVKLSSFDISVSPSGSATAVSDVGQVAITMTLDMATYDRLKLILLNTENSLRIFDLKSFAFSPSTGSVNIELISYYLNNL
jgi:hypothetical protein